MKIPLSLKASSSILLLLFLILLTSVPVLIAVQPPPSPWFMQNLVTLYYGDGSQHTVTSGDISAHSEWCGSWVPGDQWDTISLQEGEYRANGCPGFEHGYANRRLNYPLSIPSGAFVINKALKYTNVFGGHTTGAGEGATSITQITANTSVITTDGIGYSDFADLELDGPSTGTNSAVFELDWSGTGQSLQHNKFYNIFFACNGTDFGMRIGLSGNQGSETELYSPFINNCAQAAIETNNFNALGNKSFGGNIQSCNKYGVWVHEGGFSVFGTQMQNGVYAQVSNTGADIEYDNQAGNADVVASVRSESATLIRALGTYPVTVTGSSIVPPFTTWSATATYTLNTIVRGTAANQDGRLYRVTTAGTTGSTEPTWNNGTVTDGSVVYGVWNFDSALGEGLTLIGNNLPYGQVDFGTGGGRAIGNIFTRSDWRLNEDNTTWSGNNIYIPGVSIVYESSRTPASPTGGPCTSKDLGDTWFDNTSSVTTHYKVCLMVSSSPAWVTVI